MPRRTVREKQHSFTFVPLIHPRREFLELKERYCSVLAEGDAPLLDIVDPVRDASESFMSRLEAGTRAGDEGASGSETARGKEEAETGARARAALETVRWIEDALEKVNWGSLRRNELSPEELCDAAYALGNVVRLWKECAPAIERVMSSDEAVALRRRDDFLEVLSRNKKLRYPDRSGHADLDERVRSEMAETERHTDFLTWLPDECWGDGGAPLPPEPSMRCKREQYAKVASMWQQIQVDLFTAWIGRKLHEDLIPGIFDDVVTEDDLAYKLRLARSIVLSGKTNRCATIGRYQDFDAGA